jgi:hypothetical protein
MAALMKDLRIMKSSEPEQNRKDKTQALYHDTLTALWLLGYDTLRNSSHFNTD